MAASAVPYCHWSRLNTIPLGMKIEPNQQCLLLVEGRAIAQPLTHFLIHRSHGRERIFQRKFALLLMGRGEPLGTEDLLVGTA
jgi:hypothetical protein